MKKLLIVFVTLGLALGVGSSIAWANSEQNDGCDHGATGKPCVPDPQPSNGADCEFHGNDNVGGVNEDHCSTGSPTTPPPTTPPPTTSPPTPPPCDVDEAEVQCSPSPTTPPPTTPPPSETSPPSTCTGSVSTGPWYGDPHIRIKLVGAGTFVISGGGRPRLGIKDITKTLSCGQVYRTKYHVLPGHTLVVTLDGVVVVSKVAPAPLT